MLKKISDWYMKQKLRYILLAMYLVPATTATFLVPDDGGLVVWAWGAGAACIVGPFLLSVNHATKKSVGQSIWE